jgi:hypothetical protein
LEKKCSQNQNCFLDLTLSLTFWRVDAVAEATTAAAAALKAATKPATIVAVQKRYNTC